MHLTGLSPKKLWRKFLNLLLWTNINFQIDYCVDIKFFWWNIMILKGVWEKCNATYFFVKMMYSCISALSFSVQILSESIFLILDNFELTLLDYFCISLSVWLDCIKHLLTNWNYHRIHGLLLSWEYDIFFSESLAMDAFYARSLCLSFGFCTCMPPFNLVFGRSLLMSKKFWIHSALLLS